MYINERRNYFVASAPLPLAMKYFDGGYAYTPLGVSPLAHRWRNRALFVIGIFLATSFVVNVVLGLKVARGSTTALDDFDIL